MAFLTGVHRARGRRPRAAVVTSGLVATALILWVPSAFTQTPPLQAQSSGGPAIEDHVKAVFLFNFAKYVDWPSPPQGSSASIRICVPANPAFLAIVREAVRDEIVHGRAVTANGPAGLDDARECDILFVGDARTPDAAAWIGATRGRQTLTVGEGPLVNGLVIAFVRDQDRLRFDINRDAAARQKISISSRLLGLARRVNP